MDATTMTTTTTTAIRTLAGQPAVQAHADGPCTHSPLTACAQPAHTRKHASMRRTDQRPSVRLTGRSASSRPVVCETGTGPHEPSRLDSLTWTPSKTAARRTRASSRRAGQWPRDPAGCCPASLGLRTPSLAAARRCLRLRSKPDHEARRKQDGSTARRKHGTSETRHAASTNTSTNTMQRDAHAHGGAWTAGHQQHLPCAAAQRRVPCSLASVGEHRSDARAGAAWMARRVLWCVICTLLHAHAHAPLAAPLVLRPCLLLSGEQAQAPPAPASACTRSRQHPLLFAAIPRSQHGDRPASPCTECCPSAQGRLQRQVVPAADGCVSCKAGRTACPRSHQAAASQSHRERARSHQAAACCECQNACSFSQACKCRHLYLQTCCHAAHLVLFVLLPRMALPVLSCYCSLCLRRCLHLCHYPRCLLRAV
ncbi:hypothetical protein BC831DRAFT_270126 [Entophlyctis helioformis]|nr:hypothetical protein BC831DRAFT_270126 [Entophlyctis helioformis]